MQGMLSFSGSFSVLHMKEILYLLWQMTNYDLIIHFLPFLSDTFNFSLFLIGGVVDDDSVDHFHHFSDEDDCDAAPEVQ